MEEHKSDDDKNEVSAKATDIGCAFDAAIEGAGAMGLYQRLLFLAMMPFGACWAFASYGQMFLTATPQQHWCRVPELDALSLELRRNLSIPGAAQGSSYDSCTMFDANWTLILETLQPPPPDTGTVPCRDGWEFLLEDIPYATVVSEREWVCGRASLVPTAQAIFTVGAIVGGTLWGLLADKFGRLPALVLANIFGCIGGVATMFTTSFWDFAACRFITGMSCDSLFSLLYILVMEYVGVRHRTWVANFSIAFFFGFGCISLPWLALWISDWRYLCLAISLPMLLSILLPAVVPESARWLLSKGRIDEAVSILRKFERINKRKMPENVMDDLIYIAKTSKESTESPAVRAVARAEFEVGQHWLQGIAPQCPPLATAVPAVLYKNKHLRVVVGILIISFMSVAVVFDGLIRLSETLGLDFFVTFTVTSATEVPSIVLLVLLLDRFGRRTLVFVPTVLAGLLSLAVVFVERGVASVALATAARFCMIMSYNAVIQWTPELLPTGVRASGAAAVHISAFVGGILSPYIVYSERAWEGMPLVIMAAFALLGGGAALLLPETTGRPMPQTLSDGEQLAKTRLFYRKRTKSNYRVQR